MRAVVYGLVLLIVVGMIASLAGTALAAPAAAAPTAARTGRASTAAAATSPYSPASTSSSTSVTASGAPVVVLGTAGLSWSEVVSLAEGSGTAADAAREILALADAGEPVNLVQRTAGSRTCPADAWLTLGAGTRARAVADSTSACPTTVSWADAQSASSASGFAPSLGSLADALAEAGIPATAVGAGAALALTSSDGAAPRTAQTIAEALASTPSGLVLVDTTSSNSDAADPTAASSDTTTPAATAAAVTPAAAVTALAGALEAVRASAPSGTMLVVASLADPDDPSAQMAVFPAGTSSQSGSAMPSGSGSGAALLVGGSTHQAGLVQLTDLAPTILTALGAAVPETMTGSALSLPSDWSAPTVPSTVPSSVPSAAPGATPTAAPAITVPSTVRALVDDSLRANASQLTVVPVGLVLAGAALLLVLLAAWALPRAWGRRHREGLAQTAAAVGALPLGAWLGSLVPWWRAGADGDAASPAAVPAALGVMIATAVVLSLVLAGVARLVVARRDRARARRSASGSDDAARLPLEPEVPAGPASAVGPVSAAGAAPGGSAVRTTAPEPTPTAAPARRSRLVGLAPRHLPTAPYLAAALTALALPVVILADGVTGDSWAFNGMLGMNAVIAGRFYGVSNTAFAVAAAGLLVALAALVAPWAASQPTARLRRTAALLGVGVPGVLAIILDGAPGLGADVGGALTLVPALVALAAGLAGVRVGWKRWLVVGVGAVTLVGLLGFIDHAMGSRTHMGRFIGQLQDGTAAETIQRKATAIIEPFLTNPLALVALVVGLGIIAGLVPVARRVVRGLDPVPWWFGATARALAVLIVVEVLVNDSGAPMAIFSASVAAPLLIALGAASLDARVSRAAVVHES